MSPRDAGPTRAAIVAAAGELLESGGPDAVTLRAVGAAAGVSRSAPYRHYADKAELLQALAAHTLAELATGIRTGAGRKHGARRLRGGCLGYLDYAIQNPHHYQMIFGDDPIEQPTAAVERAADEGMRALVELTEQAQLDGELPAGPAREVATVLWALLHGIAQLRVTGHLHEPRTVDGERGTEALLDLALAGLRP